MYAGEATLHAVNSLAQLQSARGIETTKWTTSGSPRAAWENPRGMQGVSYETEAWGIGDNSARERKRSREGVRRSGLRRYEGRKPWIEVSRMKRQRRKATGRKEEVETKESEQGGGKV